MTSEHKSDCAVHNAPAYEPGVCDCGADTSEVAPSSDAELQANKHVAREPSPRMLDAAARSLDHAGLHAGDDAPNVAALLWRSMYDAAPVVED